MIRLSTARITDPCLSPEDSFKPERSTGYTCCDCAAQLNDAACSHIHHLLIVSTVNLRCVLPAWRPTPHPSEPTSAGPFLPRHFTKTSADLDHCTGQWPQQHGEALEVDDDRDR